MKYEEEGEFLYNVVEKKVVNVVRYYHYKTVCISRRDNDINSNV